MKADINRQEPAHARDFEAGWRLFNVRVCGSAFAYHYIVQAFLVVAMTAAAHSVQLPGFEMDAPITVLVGILSAACVLTKSKKA